MACGGAGVSSRTRSLNIGNQRGCIGIGVVLTVIAVWVGLALARAGETAVAQRPCGPRLTT